MNFPRITPGTLATIVVVLAAHAGPPALAQAPSEPDTLTLEEAVALALRTHPGVRAARAGETASAAAVGQATSANLPQIRVDTSLAQYQKPTLVAPLHAIDIRNLPQFENTLIRGDILIAYTLFDGGGRRARITGAEAGAAGATAGRESAEIALTAEVARAYLEILTAAGVLDAQDRRTEALGNERRRVELLLGEGRAARVELLRVDAALAGAEAERVAAAARLDLAEGELARLLAVPAGEVSVARLREVRVLESAKQEDKEVLLGRARAASPELARARRSVEAAEADHRVAGSTRVPRVDVSGGYLGFSSSAGDLDLEWQAGVTLSYPLFTGGARSSAINSAAALADKAREELRLTELQVERRVDQTLTVAVQARALVSALLKAVEHQAEVVRIEQLSLEAGAGTQTDYLSAEADLLHARSALVEARHAETAAWVDLARAVGELSPTWLEHNMENVP